jgi:cyclophilin family peptidyl-prolyl cis-trans isomerase
MSLFRNYLGPCLAGAVALSVPLMALAEKPAGGAAPAKAAASKYPVVILETSMGSIKVELYEDKAPITVKNFLAYVDKKHYDGTIFHRVINGFMIQGGGYDQGMKERDTGASIKNEASNGLKNTVGTLAMARTNIPDSATAQFFINVKDNGFLDFRDPSPQGIGYAVFGKVIAGMDVVDKIKAVKTTFKNGMSDVPEQTVTILSAKREKK